MNPDHASVFTKVFEGERYAVVGLGRSGAPAALRLAALGADVSVWDDRDDARVGNRLPMLLPPFDLKGFTALVLSPGIPHGLPAPHPAAAAAIAAKVPILSDAELLYVAHRRAGSRARFVGITGTNGKSTTTALLAHILTSAGLPALAGGNLGTGALALDELGDDGVFVLEMSSYMLERLATLRFEVACLLNLSPDHLDRHGTMAGYIAAKRHIFDRQEEGDLAVVGVDDPDSAAIADARPGTVRISGDHQADFWCESGLLQDRAGPLLPMAEALALPGPHNAQNAAAAAAMARHFGIGRATLAEALVSFPGLPHRQQRVGVVDGTVWVNDSKATNAEATARALACYDKVIWIAGGLAKAGGIDSLKPLFPRIAHALLIGRDGPRLSGTLRQAGIPFSLPGTLDAAVASARLLAPRLGVETVLLSPACASFDQFPNFEARGDRFAALVGAMKEDS